MNYEKLKEIRKKKKITQEEMAQALGYSGKSGYNCFENGRTKVRLEQVKIIKDFLSLNESEYEEIFLR